MSTERDRLWVDDMPAAYAEGLETAVFAPFATLVAERAAALAPRRVLEVAAGTGVVTRALADALPGVDLLATDLNAAMVAHGAERESRARWEQADVMALPVDDDAVDLVVCGFGVMFFPDKPAAAAEIRRVLAPGGRFLATIWDTVETHAFGAALTRAVEKTFPDDPPTFIRAVPHGYADPDRIRADLSGFAEVSVERVVRVGTAPSAADVARGFCLGSPLRAQLAERGEPQAAVDPVAAAMTTMLGDGPVSGEMAAFLVEART
ncbi:class I SAM-dependent methyltransferase [Pseudonocardia sp.]|uniref:class I SAM-dependent methyltransferase n=1 Tax=Pseudonocardia sp. TaxID=60912 RepID=UPI003D151506